MTARGAEPRHRPILATALGWLTMIGFDFMLHAGVLHELYARPHPFLRTPEESFAMIPIGYLSFLLAAILLVWLIGRLGIAGFGKGLRFGLMIGGLMWASFAIGLASISSAEHLLLLGWFGGQTLEIGIAGGVIALVLHTQRIAPVCIGVAVFILACGFLGIILQNLI